MCIYCGTDKYRKIYEHHYGQIPKDDLGRTYEIHHIDGNRQNNNLSNLVALSMEEHYNVHHQQKDWVACLRIAAKMNKSSHEISIMSRRAALEKIKNGTHHFTSENAKKWQKERVSNNNHNWAKENNSKYDSTIYHFEHKMTGERVHMTQNELVRIYKIHHGHISKMVRGIRKTAYGWRLVK
jgi:hypothetical protein